MKKSTAFGIVAVLVLLAFVSDFDSEPQAGSTNRIRTVDTSGSSSSQPAGIASAPSPFGKVICVSSDCSPLPDAVQVELEREELHPQTKIFALVDKIGKGDTRALSSASDALRSCLLNYRNRLVTNLALGIARPQEMNECEGAHLADLVLQVDSAVTQGFGATALEDSNSKLTQLRWLMTRALLDDSMRQLADLPRLSPDANGEVLFSDLPLPERKSPVWKSAVLFAKEQGQLDPEVQNVTKALTEMLEEPPTAVDSIQ